MEEKGPSEGNEEEDAVLLAMLENCNDLYGQQQRIAKAMRKGFLNMAKARQSMGPGSLSALDCRERFGAQISVEE